MSSVSSFIDTASKEVFYLIERLSGFSVTLGSVSISLMDVISGAFMLFAVFWVSSVLLSALEARLRRSTMSYNVRELLIKFINVFVYFTAIIIALSAVGIDLTAFAVFGGALGVGLGLGLQRITANFVSGITLLLEKSIKLGDHIQIGTDLTGVVKAMNIRYTLIETPKGTDILVPNEVLTTTNIVNLTYSNKQGRGEVTLTVTYEAPLERVLALMIDAAKGHPKVLQKPGVSANVRAFRDIGIECVVMFWVADIADGLLGPQSDIMRKIVEAFRQEGINFGRIKDAAQ